MMSRQVGKVRVSAGLVESGDVRILQGFMSIGFIPTSIDSFNSYDEYIYIGSSPHFQPLEIGEEIPYYRIIHEKAKVEIETK